MWGRSRLSTPRFRSHIVSPTSRNRSIGTAVLIFDSLVTESSKTFIANPNTTESSNATWSQQRLAVPPAASNGQVSFVSNTSSDVVTSGFFLYGHVLLLSTSSGDIQSLFGAQATDTDGVWKLVWNSTSTDGSIVPLTLKSTAPPTS